MKSISLCKKTSTLHYKYINYSTSTRYKNYVLKTDYSIDRQQRTNEGSKEKRTVITTTTTTLSTSSVLVVTPVKCLIGAI